ncbi:hypothetical protein BGZ83_002968 [Gryganskiella cystojenkinii]|nr:hypothetical protein BGZ83_002968 [Gryganskiella cystojenkinii]
MHLPTFAGMPSFIHMGDSDYRSSSTLKTPQSSSSIKSHKKQKDPRTRPTYTSDQNTSPRSHSSPLVARDINSPSTSSTATFLKKTLITRDRRLHPHASASVQKRHGRSASSRVRGKHGLVKVAALAASHRRRSHPQNGFNTSDNDNNLANRSLNLKSYMHQRRLRLRRRLSAQQAGQDLVSDLSSMDGGDRADDEDDEDMDDQEGLQDPFTMSPEQYRQYMWSLEQRLWERTQSATKSRSDFLMGRRLSASERFDHVQRVVQQRHRDQEQRRRRVREELDQKMKRAVARRAAYLEAAIENDPSRRFRRRSSGSGDTGSASESGNTSTANNNIVGDDNNNGNNGKSQSSGRRDADNNNQAKTQEGRRGHQHQLQKQQQKKTPKNSEEQVVGVMIENMTVTNRKSTKDYTKATTHHLTPSSSSVSLPLGTSTTTRGTSSSSTHVGSITNTPAEVKITPVRSEGPKKSTVVPQVRKRLSGKENMDRIRNLVMSFTSNFKEPFFKTAGFDKAAVYLQQFGISQGNNKVIEELLHRISDDSEQYAGSFEKQRRNCARVFLSAYMVVHYPDDIRTIPRQQLDASGEPDATEDSFKDLIESAKAFLESIQTWAQQLDMSKAPVMSESSNPPNQQGQNNNNNTALMKHFEQAWHTYFNLFESWKAKDAERLFEGLLAHAREIESLWQSIRQDSGARHEWEPKIEAQRQEIRKKALQIAGRQGVTRVDAVFQEFIDQIYSPSSSGQTTATASSAAASTAITSQAELALAPEPTRDRTPDATPESKAEPSSSSSEPTTLTTETTPTETVASTVKKRQRKPSTAKPATRNGDRPVEGAANPAASSTLTDDADITSSPEDSPPQTKKPTRTKNAAIAASISSDFISGVRPPAQWTNLQLLHELCLDPNFKIEPKRPHPGGGPGPDLQSSSSSSGDTATAAGSQQSLEARIRAMATKAYFDKIREDAEQGQLSKWITPLLSTIRQQLLEMVSPQSDFARKIEDTLDLEFVQQQVDQNVYNVNKALEIVLVWMRQLCAPVRDATLQGIQEDLAIIQQQQEQQGSSSQSSTTGPYTATSTTSKDLVSVLRSILELLDDMMMDMANFRLMVARPSLEKQAIPYERNAFQEALEQGETSLERTTAWLEEAGEKFFAEQPTITSMTPAPVSTSTSAPDSAPKVPLVRERSDMKSNKHFEIFVSAVLDLLFGKQLLENYKNFPETFALDQTRLSRYQNEIQAIGMVALLMNVSNSVQPPLSEQDQSELQSQLFKLLEQPQTGPEQLTEVIVEAKERVLLKNSRAVSPLRRLSPDQQQQQQQSASPVSSTTISNPSTPSPSTVQQPTAVTASQFLLSEDQKNYVLNTIHRSLSFDSTLFTVLSRSLRKVLENFILSPLPSNKQVLAPALEPQVLARVGLVSLGAEIEKVATLIRFLCKYNAQVYRSWYDNVISNVIKVENTAAVQRAVAKIREERASQVAATAAAGTAVSDNVAPQAEVNTAVSASNRTSVSGLEPMEGVEGQEQRQHQPQEQPLSEHKDHNQA